MLIVYTHTHNTHTHCVCVCVPLFSLFLKYCFLTSLLVVCFVATWETGGQDDDLGKLASETFRSQISKARGAAMVPESLARFMRKNRSLETFKPTDRQHMIFNELQ